MRTVLVAGLAVSMLALVGAQPTAAEDLLIPAQGKPTQRDPAAPTPPTARPPAPATPQTPPTQAQPPAPPAAPVSPPPNASSDEVRTVQNLLRIVGIDPGGNDGTLTDRTREAIRQFQRQANMPADGRVSATLIARLSEAVGTARTPAGGKPTPELRVASTGTGFAVSRQGHLLTNNHVAGQCTQVRVRPQGQEPVTVTVVARDATGDLALLRLPSAPEATVRFRDGRGIRAGETVVVVGFPLRGLLAAEATVTSGEVSALAGLRNDNRHLTISAPVQPGNSGGPLLDSSGNLVGIIVSKLNAQQVAQVTGDIPQNVNFAIKSSVARNFLEANGVEFEVAPSGETIPNADIADRARRFTYLVECMR
jgi:S1-C subfamily serine protease